MRNSQRVVLAVIGGLAVLILAAGIWIRVAVPQLPDLSGARGSRTYDFADFDRVGVSGQWQVTIERGDTWRVAVDAPVELLEYVRVEHVGDELRLGLDGGWQFGGGWGRNSNALEATITMPALSRLETSGASTLSFSGFEGRELSIVSSGASELRANTSRYDDLRLVMSGAGSAMLGDLTATNADVTVSGAAEVRLRMAGGTLSGRLSGASDLEYSGTVSAQTLSQSGAGSIRQRD
jgi:hypothetical protein